MPDDGFDFQPSQRRETKQFEPPPWEREAFEELERKRAERAADAARELEPPPAEQPAQQGPAAAANAEPGLTAAAGADKLDESRVAEMLEQLSEEEPTSYAGLWKFAIVAAIVLGAIGAVLIIWSMAAFVGARRSGVVGMTGGAVLLLFGAGFVASAWWLTVRTLRQRGVL